MELREQECRVSGETSNANGVMYVVNVCLRSAGCHIAHGGEG